MKAVKYFLVFSIITKIKSPNLTKKVLKEFAKDDDFRKAFIEIVTNLVRRKEELQHLKSLHLYNKWINILLNKHSSKSVKVKAVSELGSFLKIVIPEVRSMLGL